MLTRSLTRLKLNEAERITVGFNNLCKSDSRFITKKCKLLNKVLTNIRGKQRKKLK